MLTGFSPTVSAGPDLWSRYEAGAALLENEGLARIHDALAVFEEVIEQKPDFRNVYLDAAEACLLQFELRARDQPAWLDRAERYVRQLLEIESDAAEAYALLARIQGDRGAYHLAHFHLRRALQLDPGLIEARLIRLAWFIEAGQVDEALAFAEETSGYVAGEPAWLKRLGLMLLPLNRPDAVRRYLALATDGGLWDTGIMKAHAVLFIQEKRYSQAAHLFARAWQDDPGDLEAALQAAYCHAHAGAYDYAAWYMNAYLEKKPGDREALARLADYRSKQAAPTGGDRP